MKLWKRLTAAAVGAVQVFGLMTLAPVASAAQASYNTNTIAVGDDHSLVLKADGSLWAAGSNEGGQLGVGESVTESVGAKVMDNIIFAEANGDTSFAIDKDGVLYGWGNNSNGQISATDSTIRIFKPKKLMEGVVAVSAGGDHTVVLTTDGTAYGWGRNSNGALGFSANTKKNGSTKIKEGIVDIAAGDSFTLLVTSDGKLYSCGLNTSGQLGCSTSVNCKYEPTLAVSSGVVAAEAGDSHSVILKNDGTVWTAGLNDNGQLGNRSDENSRSFEKVRVTGVEAVFAGGDSSGAVTSSGKIYTWGDNSAGQLHNGRTENVNEPVAVTTNVISIALGDEHSVMLRTNGQVSAIGAGAYGELFYKDSSSVVSPEKILKEVEKFSLGTDHAAAVDSDGKLYTWGNNDCGQLGHGDYVSRSNPVKVDLKAEAVDVWCGDKMTFVLTADDRVMVFGDNSRGLLGMKTSSTKVNKPTNNFSLSDSSNIEIYPSDDFCLALIDGSVYGWGSNVTSRMLDCPSKVSDPMIIYDGFSNIKKLAVGTNHCMALESSGQVWVWGANGSGQIGNQTEVSVIDTPEMLELYDKDGEFLGDVFDDIAADDNHSMVVDADGNVWVMGVNSSGQLGASSYRYKDPYKITVEAEQVIAGKTACGVIYDTGKLALSGDNTYGALGDGSLDDRSNFVTATAKNVFSADIGDGFGCCLTYEKDLYAWGLNNHGQVGNGNGGSGSAPEIVFNGAYTGTLAQAEGLALSKTALVVKPGSTAKLTAEITPAGAVSAVTWSSSDKKVATVSASGVVTGVADGTATITAKTATGLKAECKVTVTIPVTAFTLSPAGTKVMFEGSTFTFKSKVYPVDAKDKTLLYESSDESVVKVDKNGKVTAVSAGKALITVRAKNNPTKLKQVTVAVRPAKPVFRSLKSTTDGVSLKWYETDGADGYVVYRKVYGSDSAAKAIKYVKGTEFIDYTAEKGVTYVYSIRAYIEVNGKKYTSYRSTQYKLTGK